MRNITYEIDECYHIYNRGVDKRIVFVDTKDFDRFLSSLKQLNKGANNEKLVSIISFCLLLNHFHLILSPLIEKGVEGFMHKLGTSYTNYFNKKYDRKGSLFEGPYKSKYIDKDTYFSYLVSYVTLNHVVHGISEDDTYRSALEEYSTEYQQGICDRDKTYHIIPKEDFLQEILTTAKEIREKRVEREYFDKMLID
ncbi:MAG: putative transposase [Flavobacteriaceae bacterium]|jgi:putative transposase